MSLIEVKFDHSLVQSEIVIPLTHTTKDEGGEAYTENKQEVQQTAIYGIQSPLIMVNNIVVDFTDVISFELNCTKVLPSVSMVVRDRYKLITMIDTPSLDNELRVQILPKFEDKYKKINLTFFITSTKCRNGFITIEGSYKLSKFTSSNIKSFGEISTYKLFETIATETGLGFASNIEDNESDKRWVYCDNKSYKDVLTNEIQRSGTDLQICDFWVDWWNNLVLADIYERYNAIDKDEDMQLWISGQNKDISQGVEIQPQQAVATLNNNPNFQHSELFVANYSITNNPGGQLKLGTDHLYSTYEHSKSEYLDYLVQDGDSQKDIFTSYEYLGEVYGEYNYLLAGRKRESFLQKIKSNEMVDITVRTPLLGLMRGNRVNFVWYTNDDFTKNMHKNLEEGEAIESNLDTNIPLSAGDNEDDNGMDGQFTIDKSISGQYLIIGCNMKYHDNTWEYNVKLARPTSAKPKTVIENE